MSKHQDIAWLSGLVFIDRDFVKRADEEGLDKVFARCPYGDLTESERETFTAAFKHSELREVVATWWKAYDKAREAGEIPQTRAPWSPY